MRTTRALAALTLGLGLALAGCSDDDPAARDGDGGSTDHNEADVAFATEMIPHHAQALQMVDMTEGRDLDPEFEELTTAIRAAQGPEIEAMSGWLEEWGEEVPSSDGHAHSPGMDDMEMPGMMDQGDLDDLGDAPAAGFRARWLTMMVEHHEGAIEMARTEQAEGEYAPAVELAEDIETGQTAEIETMREMLS